MFEIVFLNESNEINKSGVYSIINIVNQKEYIGSTKCFKNRIKQHFKLLKNNKHFNKHLQNSFNKYGKENFKFQIKKICKDYLESEQEFLNNIYQCDNYAEKYYNMVAFSSGQKVVSEEIKEILRQINLGKKHSEETKEKCRQASLGRIVSESTREKISKIHKNKIVSEESKEKNRLAHLGKKVNFSEEGLEKLRNTHRGNHYGCKAPILAENVETGERFIGYSEKSVAEYLKVNRSTVQARLCKGIPKYKETLINGIWRISRIIEKESE